MTHPDLFDSAFARQLGIDAAVLEQVVALAIEIAREGREGRKIGTLFVVADTDEVLKRSTPLIYDPLVGHPDELKQIGNPDMRETVKELAQLDGAFLVSNQGIVVSACRYLNASSRGIDLPKGLGSRHMAAASITRDTAAVAVVVSESSLVRIFDDGELVSEVVPELWMMRRFHSQITGPLSRHTDHEVTVVSKEV